MNEFLVLFAFVHRFCFIYWIVFLSTHGFSHLPFNFFPPIPLWGKWSNGCVVHSCLLLLTHNKMYLETLSFSSPKEENARELMKEVFNFVICFSHKPALWPPMSFSTGQALKVSSYSFCGNFPDWHLPFVTMKPDYCHSLLSILQLVQGVIMWLLSGLGKPESNASIPCSYYCFSEDFLTFVNVKSKPILQHSVKPLLHRIRKSLSSLPSQKYTNSTFSNLPLLPTLASFLDALNEADLRYNTALNIVWQEAA